MTIKRFLASTAATPASELRQALTLALATEKPLAGQGYARFYRRVLAELSVGLHTSRDHPTIAPMSAGVLEQHMVGAAPAGSCGSTVSR